MEPQSVRYPGFWTTIGACRASRLCYGVHKVHEKGEGDLERKEEEKKEKEEKEEKEEQEEKEEKDEKEEKEEALLAPITSGSHPNLAPLLSQLDRRGRRPPRAHADTQWKLVLKWR